MTPPLYSRLCHCARKQLAAVALCGLALAEWACGLEYGEAIQSGRLWLMSPAEVWEAFFQQESDVYSIYDSTLLTGRDIKPRAELTPGSRPLPRSFWFWAPSSSPTDWARAWNLARMMGYNSRLELMKRCREMRVRRISAMLYRAGCDKKEDAERLESYRAELDEWSGTHGQDQQEWQDAAGRCISTTIWEMPHCVAMLESATVQGEQDYIRLTFAADRNSLYFNRTTTKHPPSHSELSNRVVRDDGVARISGVPNFTHLSINDVHAYTPGWFEVLCYYGFHDIDNYSPRRAKNQYPGQYTEIMLRSGQESRKLYSGFRRSHMKQQDLKFMEQTEAEEIYVLDNYVEKADDWWKELTIYLDNGLPVIYGGNKGGHVITGYRDNRGSRFATSTLHGDMSAERCYMQPNSVYIILPATQEPE